MASDIGRRGIPEKLEKDKHRQNHLSQEPREGGRVAAVQNPPLLEKNVEQHNQGKRDNRLDEVNVRLCQRHPLYARSRQRRCHDHACAHPLAKSRREVWGPQTLEAVFERPGHPPLGPDIEVIVTPAKLETPAEGLAHPPTHDVHSNSISRQTTPTQVSPSTN